MAMLFAFGWVPVPVFYVPWLPFKAGGIGLLVCILLLERHRADAALHEHELEHVEQAWRGLLVIHGVLYLVWPPYRLWAEVCAYRRQIARMGPGASIDFAVKLLTTRYRLRLTEAEARRYLTE